MKLNLPQNAEFAMSIFARFNAGAYQRGDKCEEIAPPKAAEDSRTP